MPEYQPKYRWKRRQVKGHQDFAAWDGDSEFGRIVLDLTTPRNGQWIWAINHIPWQ
ncbi:hypothetical protein J2W42_005882 [Rhizobium tibeticum]|uniref:hypothetical protein n=1 Tax=Rhizobium tibeticum TaxID=501024 RepID=UPI0027805ECF|nr:hypothetical protein [Rhizobium tibeticum]MDP9813011.1 hypothetical protein [Rhizobium tibeticum]